jgi:hypothetical protein
LEEEVRKEKKAKDAAALEMTQYLKVAASKKAE